jgi:hypothetical protein
MFERKIDQCRSDKSKIYSLRGSQTSKNLPKLANKIEVIKLSIEIDTTSPMEAAKGVAKLSGFTLYLFDRRITATSTKSGI